MSGPLSIQKKAQMATDIDALLGTDEASDPSSYTFDVLLSWMTAAAQKIAALESRVKTLETQMTKVIAGG